MTSEAAPFIRVVPEFGGPCRLLLRLQLRLEPGEPMLQLIPIPAPPPALHRLLHEAGQGNGRLGLRFSDRLDHRFCLAKRASPVTVALNTRRYRRPVQCRSSRVSRTIASDWRDPHCRGECSETGRRAPARPLRRIVARTELLWLGRVGPQILGSGTIVPTTGCHPSESWDPSTHLRCGELGPSFRWDDTELEGLQVHKTYFVYLLARGATGRSTPASPAT